MEGNANGGDIAIVLGVAAALTAVFAPLTCASTAPGAEWAAGSRKSVEPLGKPKVLEGGGEPRRARRSTPASGP